MEKINISEKMEKIKHTFLSYGAGTQTFFLLVLAEQGKIAIDELVFADTGIEKPETYNHIEKVAKPICERMGIPFTTVRMSKEIDDISSLSAEELNEYKSFIAQSKHAPRTGKKREEYRKWYDEHKVPRTIVDNLYDETYKRRRVPSINPRSRFCTSDAKIIPIENYIKEQVSLGKYENPVAFIGLSYDELTRMYKPHNNIYTVSYPLIDMKLTRQDCIRLTKQLGYEVPPKSGCYICPFQNKASWAKLRKEHKDLYWRAVELEEHDLNFPRYRLSVSLDTKGPLRKFDSYFSDTTQLNLHMEEANLDKDMMHCEIAGMCGV
jgi:3'-phosphoadenosine 5'-phosphosulfate sulfotransferase (PAPS reductase)/FAD synthetase